jgi:hypothetical protein
MSPSGLANLLAQWLRLCVSCGTCLGVVELGERCLPVSQDHESQHKREVQGAWAAGEYRFCQNEPVSMPGMAPTSEPLDCSDPFIDDAFVQSVRSGQNLLELPTHIFDVEFNGKVQSDWRCRREAGGLGCEVPF